MQYGNIDDFKLKISKNNRIRQMFTDKNSVHLAFVADDSFVDFLGISIHSIVLNADKGNDYDIIVITTSMSDKHIADVLSVTADASNFSVRVAFVNELVEEQHFVVSKDYNQFTYYRLLLPDILEDFSKILYLDADLIVNCDIAKLYNVPFEGKLLVGTYDTQVAAWQNYDSGMRPYFRSLGLGRSGEYVQAGVLLFDVKNMVKEIDFNDLIQKAKTEKYILNDQDLINIFFKDKIKIVHLGWNVLNRDAVALRGCLDNLTAAQKKEYEESIKNPYIIHFAERSFPCFKIGGRFDALYWKYAKNTVFSERLEKLRQKAEASANHRLDVPMPPEQEKAPKTIKSLFSVAKQILRRPELIVSIYRHFKVFFLKPFVSELELKDMDVCGVSIRDEKHITLATGAELSCLHCIWSVGKHSVIVEVTEKEKSAFVPYYIMAGCRHITLAKGNLEVGKNKLSCYLNEAYVDVEFVAFNSSKENITISKIVLMHNG